MWPRALPANSASNTMRLRPAAVDAGVHSLLGKALHGELKVAGFHFAPWKAGI